MRLAVRRTRNAQVIGSSPIDGSSNGWEAPEGLDQFPPRPLGKRVRVRELSVFVRGAVR